MGRVRSSTVSLMPGDFGKGQFHVNGKPVPMSRVRGQQRSERSERLQPVPIGPGVYYQPVSSFDSALVNVSPVARHALSATAATADTMAAARLAARGDLGGATASSIAAWQALMGVIAPF